MNSPIANLASHATSASAVAPTVGMKVGVAVTGQYLYDAFVQAGQEETTKLGLVRKLVDQCGVTEFSNALNDMVKIAREEDVAKYGESSKEARKPTPRTKTAQNHRSVLQAAFGALKFARPQLDQLGYSDRTGYQEMGIISRQALKAVGKKWDGYTPVTVEQREKKAATELESAAMAEVRATLPQEEGESRLAYMTRIDVHVQELVDEKKAKDRVEWINVQAVKFIEKYGDDAPDVMNVVLDLFSDTEPVDTEAVKSPVETMETPTV